MHATLANAPKAVSDLYAQSFDARIDEGDKHHAAHGYALRQVQHAGWYKGKGGRWSRLTPDLREKVNVRQAVEQPDGTFCVYDVDVFQPNAVKGADLTFTEGDVGRMITNTNRAIASGGQKPGLTEGHPHPLQFAQGLQLPVYGNAVNWRSSTRGKGWARCDLVDVRREAIDRLRNRQLTGLSAGLAQDAGGLNRRFGHVAMLGGSTQALASLPLTEVFASSHAVCFSAEVAPADATFTKGRPPMNRAMFAAISAAAAAVLANEPGAEAKWNECRTQFGAEMMGGADPLASGDPAATPADPSLACPAAAPAPINPTLPDAPAFEADPTGAFAALSSAFEQSRRENIALAQSLKGLLGKEARTNFAATVEGLKREGHQLPDDSLIDGMFRQSFSSANPTAGVAQLVAFLKGTPKRESVAALGTVFGTEQAPAFAAGKPGKYSPDVQSILNDIAPGIVYSAEDVAFGEMIAGVESKRK